MLDQLLELFERESPDRRRTASDKRDDHDRGDHDADRRPDDRTSSTPKRKQSKRERFADLLDFG